VRITLDLFYFSSHLLKKSSFYEVNQQSSVKALSSFFISGNYQKALETYKEIHRKFPDNVECNSCCFLSHFSAALLNNSR